MKSVEVLVKEDGSVQVKYDGFRGEACFEEAKRIYEQLKNLGVNVDVKKVQRIPEAYVAEKQKVVNHA